MSDDRIITRGNFKDNTVTEKLQKQAWQAYLLQILAKSTLKGKQTRCYNEKVTQIIVAHRHLRISILIAVRPYLPMSL